MMVHEIRTGEKQELKRFITAIQSVTPTINVNNPDPDVDEVDIDAVFQQNPTIPVPYQIGIELCYWRKHPDLHGWMRDLFYEKGGKSETSFNGDVVFLTVNDVENLRTAIVDEKLPYTSGFFFGESEGRAKDNDLLEIDKMLKALEKGSSIYYTSSW
jgi:hypothetical protein